MPELVEDLKLLIRTRHAIVAVRTAEEEFASRLIRQAADELGMVVMEWALGRGIRRMSPTVGEAIGRTDTLPAALGHIHANPKTHVYVLKDALRHVASDPKAERLLRDIAAEFARDRRTLFLIDATGEVPASVRLFAVPYDVPLPDDAEIERVVRAAVGELRETFRPRVRLTSEQLRQFLSDLRGLTRAEITQLVTQAFLDDHALTAEDLPRAIERKRARLRQTGVLDFLPPPERPIDLGGMARLREWLSKRAGAFGPDAREYGLDSPRGILMLGVQGCGKSLMARFVAADWGLPLLRMDVGALYDKYIGETERHLRQAFAAADAMAPCVLWIDEIEKGFASATEASRSDGGLSQRVFGQLLTWMQEHEQAVFLVATANDIAALPPELLRKGRFDEVFFVDLPSPEARRKIFEIHIAPRGREATAYDLDALTDAADAFSGAEIEQAIVSAMYAAFAEKR